MDKGDLVKVNNEFGKGIIIDRHGKNCLVEHASVSAWYSVDDLLLVEPYHRVFPDVEPDGLTLLIAVYGYNNLRVPVKSLSDASLTWCTFRDGENESSEVLGCSAMRKGCGNIYDRNGKRVARVAYNGRVFDLNDDVLLEAVKACELCGKHEGKLYPAFMSGYRCEECHAASEAYERG